MIAAAAAVLVYLGSLQFDFVYDDRLQILDNPWIQSWRYLPRYFNSHLWAFSRPTAVGFWWRPLYLVWFRLNDAAFGLRPMPWHVTTIALHVPATVMVFLVARRLSANAGIATTAALIFAVHPAAIETAAWVSGVPDSLCVILLLAALLLYARGHSIAMAAVYGVALLVKESVIVFPLALVAYRWIFREPDAHRKRARSAGTATLLVVIIAVYLAVRQHVLKGFTRPADIATAVHALLTAPGLVWWYLRMVFVPWPISVHYDNQLLVHPSLLHFVLPLLGLLALAAVVIWWWRRSADSQAARAAKFGIAWTALFLVPPLYLPAVTRADFAHVRYLYLPMAGTSLLLAAALSRLGWGKRWRGVPLRQAIAVGAAVLVLAALNLDQQVYWANDLVLFAHGAQVAPHNASALADFGVQLGSQGHFERALVVLQDAARQDPSSWYAVASLAYTQFALHREAEAEKNFLLAIRLLPAPVEQYLYLGIVASRLQKMDEAEWALGEAIRRQPRTPRYHMALALVLEQEGKTGEAAEAARKELEIDPAAQDARELLARVSSAPK